MLRGRRIRTRARALAPFVLAPLLLSAISACAKSDDEWAAELSSTDLFVRGLAAIAIAEQAPERGRDAFVPLLEVIDGRPSPLRPHAGPALAVLAAHFPEEGVRAVFQTVFVSEENRTTILDALVALGPPAIPPLAAEMDGPSTERTREIGALFERMGDRAIEPLAQIATSDPREPVRQSAAWLLGKSGRGAQSALPALVAALRSTDPVVARSAAESLQRIDPGGSRSLDALRLSLAHADASVRRAAAESVGRILAVRAATTDTGERAVLLAEAVRLGDAAVPGAVEAALNADAARARFGTDVLLVCAARWSVARETTPLSRERLDELEHQVRKGPGRGVAALELGRHGARAKAAMPALSASLASELAGLRTCAALALACIATDVARVEPARRRGSSGG